MSCVVCWTWCSPYFGLSVICIWLFLVGFPPIGPEYRFIARNWYSGMNLNQKWQKIPKIWWAKLICSGKDLSLELSKFFLTLLKVSIFAAGGKTVFNVEFVNLQQSKVDKV